MHTTGKKRYIYAEKTSGNSVDMKKNYWHRVTAQEIERCVFDQHDDPELGEIVYNKFLLECDTTIPISPPANVKKQYINGNWKISWDENPEADLSHYVLYYGDFVDCVIFKTILPRKYIEVVLVNFNRHASEANVLELNAIL